jgi:hypothetical protein
MKMILSVDPGKATGMTLFSFERGQEPVLVWAGEYQQEEYAKPIRETLVEYPDVTVVCERFIINAQTAKKSQAPYSLEQIGILKQCLMDAGRKADDIIFQSPSDAKAMFDNPKLKKLEYWYVGGEGHALDSLRHALLQCVKLGWIPRRLLQ